MTERRYRLAIRILLLALLLAVQGLCHAHAIDHQADGGSSACLVCSFGGTLDDAVCSGIDAEPLTAFHASPPTAPAATLPREVKVRPGARGPPSPA